MALARYRKNPREDGRSMRCPYKEFATPRLVSAKRRLAAHQEKRLGLEAGKLRAETLGVVVLLDIHNFLG